MTLNYRNQKNAEAIARFWGKSLDNKDWYSIKAEGDEAELRIFDVIGYPFVDEETFVRDLNAIKAKTVTIRINSPGGDVFSGLTVANAIRNHPAKTITRIEGLAASIASVVAIAADEVQAYSNTMYMIHRPWVLAIGNDEDLRDIADVLTKIGGQLLNEYQQKTGLDKNDLSEMMKAESWFTAAEAKEKGFIDKVLGTTDEKAKAFNLSVFNNAPDILPFEQQLRNLTIREVEKILIDGGAPRAFAKAVASRGCAGAFYDHREDDEDAAIEQLFKTLKGAN